ncbi:SWIM zinc finger family protein [Paenibacillus sp. N1-5-1-14]|uniref:SWIM zinc finger family protein n=1 Tax=Paenibacillus radicibacter TaxID=2972488 RepID=UPI002158FAA7|nr:SWIM zinc finger family protein [Paenibacillus radicibacter]MCR8642603.1 SWIM zinc finger family protein [Paenibacillus radicibacter]
MLKLHIPKNRIEYLLKQLKHYHEWDDVEQGWTLFHKGKVLSLDLLDENLVSASVREKKPLNVRVHLDEFTRSKCACTDPKPCVHMAAVIFAIYATQGRPEMILQELKKYLAKKSAQRAAKLRLDEKKDANILPEMDDCPTKWQRYFEGRFNGFVISHQYTFEMFASAVWDLLLPLASSWNKPERKRLFCVNIALFALRRIENFYEATKSAYLSSYHETSSTAAVTTCEQRLLDMMQAEEMGTIQRKDASAWQETLLLLSEYALSGRTIPVDWLQIYRLIWWNLTSETTLIENEKKRLDAFLTSLDKKKLTERQHDVLIIARAHFDVMEHQIKVAFDRLEQLHTCTPSDYYMYLKHNREQGNWTALQEWLQWLLPVMHTVAQEDFRALCQFWSDAAKQLQSDHEWVQAMETLLPRSYYYYTAYLLQTKRYRKWVDLQLATRVSPLNLYNVELRTVEEADCKLLLPLYHQAIERLILEKNRSSYKTALAMLKKLNEYYAKLGKLGAWHFYLEGLQNKFARLRAFQDELMKGPWKL